MRLAQVARPASPSLRASAWQLAAHGAVRSCEALALAYDTRPAFAITRGPLWTLVTPMLGQSDNWAALVADLIVTAGFGAL